MVCREILGNLNDPSFEIVLRQRLGGSFMVDALVLDGDDARSHELRAVTGNGVEVSVNLDSGLPAGLSDGDVLGTITQGGDGRPVVVVVRLRSAEVLQVEVSADNPIALARAAWEIGNMHAPLFRGDEMAGVVQFLTPINGPLLRVLAGIEGVRVTTAHRELDPGLRFSTGIVNALVKRAPDLKIVRRRAC